MFTAILYDKTFAGASGIDTGAVNMIKQGVVDAVAIEVSGDGTYAGAVTLYDADVSSTCYLMSLTAATSSSAVSSIGWGPGVGSAAAATQYLGGLPSPLPINIEVKCAANGTANCRIRIIGVNTSGR